MTDFKPIPAGQVRVGQKTQFGTGYESNWRTVSKVERQGRGIVRIFYTSTRFFDEYGEAYPIMVLVEND